MIREISGLFRDRERESQRERDRQTDRQTDRQRESNKTETFQIFPAAVLSCRLPTDNDNAERAGESSNLQTLPNLKGCEEP